VTTPEQAAAATRGVLVAIVESTDRQVTANERLRAVELLREMGGTEDGSLALAAWVSGMTEHELAATLADLAGPVPAAVLAEREAEVARRVAEALPAAVEARLAELRPELEAAYAARADARARKLVEALYAERVGVRPDDE